MIDIVIATHGSLSRAFEETAKLIVGKTNPIQCVGFFHGDDVECLEKEIESIIQTSLKKQRQVLVFVDLLGGSPSNRSAMLLNNLNEHMKDVEIVVGVNLPMLLEAVLNAETVKNVQELKKQVMRTGKEGIVDLKEKFHLNEVSDK